MIKPDMIPDKVVEAAARVLHSHAEIFDDLLWEDISQADQEAYFEEARASIAAALNAWPGFEYRADVAFPAFGYGPAAIILPLPQEKTNDQA